MKMVLEKSNSIKFTSLSKVVSNNEHKKPQMTFVKVEHTLSSDALSFGIYVLLYIKEI